MKACKKFGTVLFGLGCAAAFAALTSLFAKATDNPQLQLVLQSFYTDSPHPAVTLFNTVIVFCLSHTWQVLAVGGIAMFMGSILLLETGSRSRHTHPKESAHRPTEPSRTLPIKPALSSQDNPFAVAVWEEETPSAPVNTFAPVVSQTKRSETAASYWYKPLLEENRVDASGASSPFERPKQNSQVSSAATKPENIPPCIRGASGTRRRAHYQTRRP